VFGSHSLHQAILCMIARTTWNNKQEMKLDDSYPRYMRGL